MNEEQLEEFEFLKSQGLSDDDIYSQMGIDPTQEEDTQDDDTTSDEVDVNLDDLSEEEFLASQGLSTPQIAETSSLTPEQLEEIGEYDAQLTLTKEGGALLPTTLAQYIDNPPTNYASDDSAGWGIGDFVSDMYLYAKGGFAQGDVINEAASLFAGYSDKEEIEEYMKAVRDAEKVPIPLEQQAWEREIQECGGGAYCTLKASFHNPSALVGVGVSSLAMMLNRTSLGTGAVVGATGFVGNPVAAPMAIGMMSATTDTLLTFSDMLREELGDKEFNENNIRSILEEEHVLGRMRTKAAARGAVIGLIDAITLGVATKIGANVAKTSVKAAGLKGAAAGLTTEAVGGSFGEFGGQIAAGQEIDTGEILVEGLAEVFGLGGISVGRRAFNNPKYTVNGARVSENNLVEFVRDNDFKSIESANINVTNNEKISDDIGRIIETKRLDSQIDERVEKGAPRGAAISIQRKLDTLKEDDSEGARIQKKALRDEMQKIYSKYVPGIEYIPPNGKSQLSPITEQEIAEVEADLKPYEQAETETPTGPKRTKSKYSVTTDEDGNLITADTDGKRASAQTESKLIAEELTEADFTVGQTLEEKGIGITNPEEVGSAVAADSDNAIEVAQTLQAEKQKSGAPIKSELEGYLKNIRIKATDFDHYADRNLRDPRMNRQWFKKDALALDIIAQEASDQLGVTITEQDIVDTVVANPTKKFSGEVDNTVLDLQAKFTELTGAKPTTRNINAVIKSQEYAKRTVEEKVDQDTGAVQEQAATRETESYETLDQEVETEISDEAHPWTKPEISAEEQHNQKEDLISHLSKSLGEEYTETPFGEGEESVAWLNEEPTAEQVSPLKKQDALQKQETKRSVPRKQQVVEASKKKEGKPKKQESKSEVLTYAEDVTSGTNVVATEEKKGVIALNVSEESPLADKKVAHRLRNGLVKRGFINAEIKTSKDGTFRVETGGTKLEADQILLSPDDPFVTDVISTLQRVFNGAVDFGLASPQKVGGWGKVIKENGRVKVLFSTGNFEKTGVKLDTLIHEPGHIIYQMIEASNDPKVKSIFNRINDLIADTKEYKDIKNESAYSNLTEQGVRQEAFARYFGKKQASKLFSSSSKLDKAISALLRYVKKAFGVDINPETLSLQDISDILLADILSGNPRLIQVDSKSISEAYDLSYAKSKQSPFFDRFKKMTDEEASVIKKTDQVTERMKAAAKRWGKTANRDIIAQIKPKDGTDAITEAFKVLSDDYNVSIVDEFSNYDAEELGPSIYDTNQTKDSMSRVVSVLGDISTRNIDFSGKSDLEVNKIKAQIGSLLLSQTIQSGLVDLTPESDKPTASILGLQ